MKRRAKSRAKTTLLQQRPVANRNRIQNKAQVEQLIQRLKKDLNGPMGMKFIKTVFYPELFKARIPYSLNNQSTALVTHIEEVDVNSGPDGAGMLYFFPKITNGPCVYQYLSSVASIPLYKHTLNMTKDDVYKPTSGAGDVVMKGCSFYCFKQSLGQSEVQDILKATCGSPVFSVTYARASEGVRCTIPIGNIDNQSLHPMFYDYVQASVPIPNAPPIVDMAYPGNSAKFDAHVTLITTQYQKQTSLVQNLLAIQPFLSALFKECPTDIAATAPNLAPVLFSNTWPPVPGDVKFTLANTNGSALIPNWSGLCSQNYSTSYDKVALAGASLTMEYVGRFDYEAGYISASHLEDISIDSTTTQDIDKGQFQVKAKPNEGLRMVWQPTQQADFELFFTSANDQTSAGARILSQSQLSYQKLIQKSAQDPTYAQSKSYKLDSSSPCIALYWKGLTPGQQAFRLNVTRRFNMIPQKQLKAVADLNRPDINIDPNLTMQKVFQLTRLAPFGGSTLADAQLYNGVRQNFINTLEINPNAKFGSLKELDSVLSGDISGDPADNE